MNSVLGNAYFGPFYAVSEIKLFVDLLTCDGIEIDNFLLQLSFFWSEIRIFFLQYYI